MQIKNLINQIDINKYIEIVKTKKKILLLLLLVVIPFAGYTIYSKYKVANPNTLYTIVSPQERDITKSISVSGEIKSGSEIELGSDASGQLVNLYVEIGDIVESGQVIAKIENSSQRAQLTQSLGGLRATEAQLESAKAQLEKVKNGSTIEDKNIVSSQVSAARSSLISAQDTARNILQAAYAGTVNAILFGTDVAIKDEKTSNPTLSFNTVENSAKLSVENNRVLIGEIVNRHKKQSAYDVSDEDLDAELQKIQGELLKMQKLTDDLLVALNGAITSSSMPVATISSYTTTVSSARTQILSNITALTSARYAIVGAENALQTSQENENKVFSGARTEDVDVAKAGVQAAEAAVLSAQGNYQAAKATLDKTYIKSPQYGTIVDIYKEVGEFIQSSVPVIKISSKDVYVSAMISEVDIAKTLKGMLAQIVIDALPAEVFNGKIDFIYPDKVEELGIIYYEVKVDASELQNSGMTILPGMSLDVTIPYESREGVLSIKRSATNKDGDRYFVQILNPNKKKPIDEKFSKVYFDYGFIGDEYVEVLDGLDNDMEIVEFSKAKK